MPGRVLDSTRRRLISEIKLRLTQGQSERDCIDFLLQHVSRRSAHRYIEVANKEHARRLENSRHMLIARQSAKLDRVQEMAHDEANLPALIQAISAQSKLLGLDAPRKVAMLLSQLNPLLDVIAQVLIDEVTDDDLLGRIIDAIRGRVLEALPETGLEETPAVMPVNGRVIDAPKD